MISKISFSKLVLNDMKRRIWVVAILLLGFFLILPVGGLMMVESNSVEISEGFLTYPELILNAQKWVGCGNLMTTLWVIAGAVFCAFTGFIYLYSKKKLDIYHSIPIKREKLFLVQFISGMGLFFIPFLCCELLTLLVFGLKGVFSIGALVSMGIGILFHLIHFLLVYIVAILAIMLTGKMLVGVLGMLVFWFYAPAVKLITEGYFVKFFNTYYMMPREDIFSTEWAYYFSPVSLYMTQTNAYLNYEGSAQGIFIRLLIPFFAAVLLSILLLILVIWLYKKRSSEAAEHSMVFPKTNRVIKVLLMIPLSMACGLLFDGMTSSNSEVWFFFGIIFGLLVFHCIIEVIYQYDVKKVFSHKVSLAVAAACTILLTLVFWLDILGYDAYKPNENSVESVALSFDGLDTNVDYNLEDEGYDYIDYDVYRLQHMQLKNVPEAYEVIEAGIKNTRDKTEKLVNEENYNSLSALTVCYNMNNGKKVYRSYEVELTELEPQLEVLYNNKNFKEAVYPILTQSFKSYTDIYIQDPLHDYVRVAGSEEELEKVFNAYKEELQTIRFSEMKKNPPMGTLIFNKRNNSEFSYSSEYDVYPGFKTTQEILKEIGIEMQAEIDPDLVDRIEVTKYTEDSEIAYLDDPEFDETKVFTDQSEIKEILNCIVWDGTNGIYVDYGWDILVVLKNNDGKEIENYFYFREGDIPNIVKAAF